MNWNHQAAAKWWPSKPHRSNHWIPGGFFQNCAAPHTGRHSLKQGSSSQFLTPTVAERRCGTLRNSSARVALRERWWSEHVPIIYPFWVVSLLTICGGSHGFTLKEKQPILLYTLTFQCNGVKIWIFRCSTVGFTDASWCIAFGMTKQVAMSWMVVNPWPESSKKQRVSGEMGEKTVHPRSFWSQNFEVKELTWCLASGFSNMAGKKKHGANFASDVLVKNG